MKRLAVALAAGAAVSSLAFASASVLNVDGGTIQAGQDTTLSCDADGVKANWGLETDTNTVQTVRISDIDETCYGAELFVAVNGTRVNADAVVIDAASETIRFATPFPTPESINDVKIWIEG